MSAYGYGSTYNTSWRSDQSVQPGQPTAHSIAPDMQLPNFNPIAGQAMATPGLNDVGNWTIRDSYRGSSGGDYLNRGAWANPLDTIFGSQQQELDPQGYGKSNSMGSQFQQGEAIYGFAGPNAVGSSWNQGQMNNYLSGNHQLGVTDTTKGWGDRERSGAGVPEQIIVGYRPYQGQMDNGKGGPAYNRPQNTKELFDQIGGLGLDQMMRLSSNGGLSNQFSNVAQSYKNAYANPEYGKHLWGQQATGYGGNTMSEKDTMDYLQKSHDQLATRMNNNYLL